MLLNPTVEPEDVGSLHRGRRRATPAGRSVQKDGISEEVANDRESEMKVLDNSSKVERICTFG